MVRNLDECDEALRQIALIEITVGIAEQLKVAEQLEAENKFTTATASELARKKKLAEEVEAYYRANRKTFEVDGKRSKELNFGRIGFQKGKPSLGLMKGWKWAKVIEAIKGRFGGTPRLDAFLTTTTKPNKEGIKAQLSDDEMEKIGVRLKQPDEFFIKTFPEKVKSPIAA